MLQVKEIAALLLLGVGLTSAQFTTCFPSVNPQQAASNVFDFSGVDKFGMPLLSNLSVMTSGSNLLLSPFSIWSALSLALIGAQGNTKRQLENGLGLPDSKLEVFRTKSILDFLMGIGGGDGVELRSIDYAYFDENLSLRPCVKNHILKVENLQFSNADAAAARINNDVSQATGGEIKDFLKSTSLVNALFVLINAVYFKGKWSTEFDARNTRDMPFTKVGITGRQETFQVPMMFRTGNMKIANSAVMGSDVLELPYRSSNISMFVILPRDANSRIEDVLGNLTPFSFLDVRNAMKDIPVSLTMPKFDLESKLETELKDVLIRMGMSDMFNAAVANFQDFTDQGVVIDAAIHQAKVRVDEQGTVAAAATGLVATRAGPGQFVNFNLNRPFAFLIYDKRLKLTLFSGIIHDPRQ